MTSSMNNSFFAKFILPKIPRRNIIERIVQKKVSPFIMWMFIYGYCFLQKKRGIIEYIQMMTILTLGKRQINFSFGYVTITSNLHWIYYNAFCYPNSCLVKYENKDILPWFPQYLIISSWYSCVLCKWYEIAK